MDRTRVRPTGNPLAGRAAVGAPLLSPVPALVPVSAESAWPRGRGGLTGASAGLWVLVPLVLWMLIPLVLGALSYGVPKSIRETKAVLASRAYRRSQRPRKTCLGEASGLKQPKKTSHQKTADLIKRIGNIWHFTEYQIYAILFKRIH